MRPAFAALTAALLLIGSQSQAQDAAGTTENKATAAEPGTAPVEPAVRPPAEPKPGAKLILDVLNELVRPRPAPLADTAAPSPSGPFPASGATDPAPAGAAAAEAVTASGAVPRDVKAEPAAAAPRPLAATESVPAPGVPAAAEPAGATSDANAGPPPAPTVVAQPAAEERAGPDATTATPGSFPGAIGWLLLGLLAAAAGVASALHVRRTRRIARTRAALALEPRLDLSAGACTFTGLSLACPPLAIRTRLDLGETRGG